MACGYVCNNFFSRTINSCANNADSLTALHERGNCSERTLFLITEEIGVEADSEGKPFRTFRRLIRPHDKNGCCDIGEPQHCAGMNNTEGILHAGANGHL